MNGCRSGLSLREILRAVPWETMVGSKMWVVGSDGMEVALLKALGSRLCNTTPHSADTMLSSHHIIVFAAPSSKRRRTETETAITLFLSSNRGRARHGEGEASTHVFRMAVARTLDLPVFGHPPFPWSG